MPSPGDSCATCFFSVNGPNGLECRVSAPIGVSSGGSAAQRIIVQPSYWCGSFSLTVTPGTSGLIAGPQGETGAVGATGAQGIQGVAGTNAPVVPPIVIAGATLQPNAVYATEVTTQATSIQPAQSVTQQLAISGLVSTDIVSLVVDGLPFGVVIDNVAQVSGSAAYTLINNNGVATTLAPLSGTLTILRTNT